MAINLLSVCSVGPVTTREGHVGANALILLPFSPYGFWSPAGKQYSFPRSQVPQNSRQQFGPVPMPDNFQKSSCCDCGGVYLSPGD